MSGPIGLISRFKWQFLIMYLVMVAGQFLVVHLELGYDAKSSLIDAALTHLFLMIVVLLVVQFLSSYQRTRNNLIYTAIISVLETAVTVLIVTHFLSFLSNEVYVDMVKNTFWARMVLAILVTSGFIKSLLLFLHVEELSKEDKIKTASDLELRDAELQKLQHQLQPHFLFNSLNSINALILAKPDEASLMVTKLSEYLRYTSQKKDLHFVTVKEELDNLNLYLDIELVRFGHRLVIERNVDEKCLETQIPTFILQPLVENAIKFGLYGKTGNIKIALDIQCNLQDVMITISNPFEKDMLPPKGTGFGLKGIRRRLYLLYARNDMLDTTENNQIFTVSLKIPFKK